MSTDHTRRDEPPDAAGHAGAGETTAADSGGGAVDPGAATAAGETAATAPAAPHPPAPPANEAEGGPPERLGPAG
ncbi:MAG: hypothetical protein ACYCX3_15190, partial [Thermoleophilia bacterium]